MATQLEIQSRIEFDVVEYCGAGKFKWNSEQNQHVRVSSSKAKITNSVIFILKFKEIFNEKITYSRGAPKQTKTKITVSASTMLKNRMTNNLL